MNEGDLITISSDDETEESATLKHEKTEQEDAFPVKKEREERNEVVLINEGSDNEKADIKVFPDIQVDSKSLARDGQEGNSKEIGKEYLLSRKEHDERSSPTVKANNCKDITQLTISNSYNNVADVDSLPKSSAQVSKLHAKILPNTQGDAHSPRKHSSKDNANNRVSSKSTSGNQGRAGCAISPKSKCRDDKETVRNAVTNSFKKFVEKVKSLEEVDEHKLKLEKKLLKYYERADPDYVKSSDFENFLDIVLHKLNKSPAYLYVIVKEALDNLAEKRVAVPVKKRCTPVRLDGECLKSNRKEFQNEDDYVYFESNEENDLKIRKLTKTLKKLRKRIKFYEEKEADLSDEEDSSFIKMQRYRERFCQVYKKVCELTGQLQDPKRVCRRKIHFSGTKYPAINENIEKWLNKTNQFPDFADIVKFLEDHENVLSLKLTKDQVRNLATEIFTEVGNSLQRRRKYDLWDSFSSVLDLEEDPADKDPELQSILRKNFEVGIKKEQDLINYYAEKQVNDQIEPLEVPDEEANQSPVESGDEDEAEIEIAENALYSIIDSAISCDVDEKTGETTSKGTRGEDAMSERESESCNTDSDGESKSIRRDESAGVAREVVDAEETESRDGVASASENGGIEDDEYRSESNSKMLKISSAILKERVNDDEDSTCGSECMVASKRRLLAEDESRKKPRLEEGKGESDSDCEIVEIVAEENGDAGHTVKRVHQVNYAFVYKNFNCTSEFFSEKVSLRKRGWGCWTNFRSEKSRRRAFLPADDAANINNILKAYSRLKESEERKRGKGLFGKMKKFRRHKRFESGPAFAFIAVGKWSGSQCALKNGDGVKSVKSRASTEEKVGGSNDGEASPEHVPNASGGLGGSGEDNDDNGYKKPFDGGGTEAEEEDNCEKDEEEEPDDGNDKVKKEEEEDEEEEEEEEENPKDADTKRDDADDVNGKATGEEEMVEEENTMGDEEDTTEEEEDTIGEEENTTLEETEKETVEEEKETTEEEKETTEEEKETTEEEKETTEEEKETTEEENTTVEETEKETVEEEKETTEEENTTIEEKEKVTVEEKEKETTEEVETVKEENATVEEKEKETVEEEKTTGEEECDEDERTRTVDAKEGKSEDSGTGDGKEEHDEKARMEDVKKEVAKIADEEGGSKNGKTEEANEEDKAQTEDAEEVIMMDLDEGNGEGVKAEDAEEGIEEVCFLGSTIRSVDRGSGAGEDAVTERFAWNEVTWEPAGSWRRINTVNGGSVNGRAKKMTERTRRKPPEVEILDVREIIPRRQWPSKPPQSSPARRRRAPVPATPRTTPPPPPLKALPSNEDIVEKFLRHSPASVSIVAPKRKLVTNKQSNAVKRALETLSRLKSISTTVVKASTNSRPEEDVVVIGESPTARTPGALALPRVRGNAAGYPGRPRPQGARYGKPPSPPRYQLKITNVRGNVPSYFMDAPTTTPPPPPPPLPLPPPPPPVFRTSRTPRPRVRSRPDALDPTEIVLD